MSVRLHVCSSVYPSVHPSVLLSVCLLARSNPLPYTYITVPSKTASQVIMSCDNLASILTCNYHETKTKRQICFQRVRPHTVTEWKSARSSLECKSYSPQSVVNSSDLSPQSSSLLHNSESSTHLPFEQANSRPLQTTDLLTH